MIAFDEAKSAQNDYFCIIMEIKHIFSVCLLAALGVAAAYGQVANTEEDEEPIDLELVRKPVRRPCASGDNIYKSIGWRRES